MLSPLQMFALACTLVMTLVGAEADRTQQLMASLERDPSCKVRLQAAVLLGRSKDVRAAQALAEAGDAKAIAALEKVIADQENARIAQIVRNSLQILERKKNGS